MRTMPLLLCLLPLAVAAQTAPTPAGRWKTVDDATGKPKSVVEIRSTPDGRFAGKVVEILDTKDGPDPRCDKCSGPNKHKPIKGMTILWDLRADGPGQWGGGQVLDPEKGKAYRAKLQLLDGGRKLGMSGCIAFLCRQQVWLRQ